VFLITIENKSLSTGIRILEFFFWQQHLVAFDDFVESVIACVKIRGEQFHRREEPSVLSRSTGLRADEIYLQNKLLKFDQEGSIEIMQFAQFVFEKKSPIIKVTLTTNLLREIFIEGQNQFFN